MFSSASVFHSWSLYFSAILFFSMVLHVCTETLTSHLCLRLFLSSTLKCPFNYITDVFTVCIGNSWLSLTYPTPPFHPVFLITGNSTTVHRVFQAKTGGSLLIAPFFYLTSKLSTHRNNAILKIFWKSIGFFWNPLL